MLTKYDILFLLESYSSFEHPMSAKALLRQSGISMSQTAFQRQLAKIIKDEIWVEEFQKMQRREDYSIPLATDRGYYIARTRGEAVAGINFYVSRVFPVLENRTRLKRMLDRKFPVEEIQTEFEFA